MAASVCAFIALALDYVVGVHHGQTGTGSPIKPYDLSVGLFGRVYHMRLTVGVVGLAVIFALMVMLSVAIALALLTQRRKRDLESANRQLQDEIKERVRAEEEVKSLNADLERRVAERTVALQEANRELESFSYSVSHDLRAPLRHISAFSKILAEEASARLDASGQHYLDRIQDGARHMGQLVDDLLRLGHISRQEIVSRPADMGSVLADALREVQTEAQGRRIEWRVRSMPTIQCDPGLMKVVFTNLLSNAVKYTRLREDAIIEVGQMAQNGECVFFVRDNGTGFDPRYTHKLFGVFQRLHSSETFDGTGVGLATVQRIIHRHGGRVWAEGELDRGATFFFTLQAGRQGRAKAEIPQICEVP